MKFKGVQMLNVLVVCEHSQHVAFEFRVRGFNAYSCDILDCSGGFPEWHLKGCGFDDIRSRKWDLIIMHCPCTFTSVSGNRWYANTDKRFQGIEFTSKMYSLALSVCDCVVLEQPKTVMQPYIGKRSQSIQPWQFGHGETKETWLWVNGLPLLHSTDVVDGRESRIWLMAPSSDRGHLRSLTYPGIAEAMAVQWGDFLKKKGGVRG